MARPPDPDGRCQKYCFCVTLRHSEHKIYGSAAVYFSSVRGTIGLAALHMDKFR